MKLYTAGPMRGILYYNFPAFDKAKEFLTEQGHDVISPADLDRDTGFDPLSLPADFDWFSTPQNFDLNACVKRDTEAIMECDGIALLDGWQNSTGAKAELALAQWLKLEILDAKTGKAYEFDTQKNATKGEVIVVNKATGGKKGSKLARFGLIPPIPLKHVAEVYGFGCGKYDPRNWEKGYSWELSYSACLRHLDEFWAGTYLDDESGLPHLAHAVWHCLTMMQFADSYPHLDDRSKLSQKAS